jgi:NADH-ubiquinone oxidoreductase chain 2
MITITILILIVAKALPGLNTHIYPIHVTRITSIVFLFASALSFNCLNIEILCSSGGIGIFSGFYQITIISQIVEIFLFIIGGGILIAWPQIEYNNLFNLSGVAKPMSQASLFNPTMLSIAMSVHQAPNLKKSAKPTGQKINSSPENKNLCSLAKASKGTDYSLIVLFSSLGSSLLISSYDLISIYLSIELQSFGLYVLSTLYKDKESSTSAGLKYFLLGGLSSCILLLGTAIIYSYTGTTSLESIYLINSVIDINLQYIIQGTSLGLSLIFIGFLFKIAAAPLHNWSPDVYDGTPTIVTTWLTIIPKIAILFILLELQVKLGSFSLIGYGFASLAQGELFNLAGFFEPNILEVNTQGPWPSPSYFYSDIINNTKLAGGTAIFLISSFLSLIIGSLLGLAQKKIKRLLAYSTISHLGFILLALSITTEQSIDSFIFYIIQYTITNLNIFLIILGLTYYFYYNNKKVKGPWAKVDLNNVELELELELEKDISFISELKGLFFKNPLLSFSLIVSLFSMAGIPPLIGFFSKQLVLYSALQNGYYFLSLVAIIVSVISCSYYLQIVKILITTIPSSYFETKNNKINICPKIASQQALSFLDTPEKLGAKPQGSLGQASSLRRVRNKLTNTHSYLIAILTLTNIFFFIKPSLILNSTQLLSLSLFYI